MLAKKYKLPIQEFVSVRPSALKRGRLFTLKLFATTLPYSRFGVVISKKAAARAAERNRLRRIIFNSVRVHTPAGGPKDVLVIVHPSISTAADKSAIIEELHSLL